MPRNTSNKKPVQEKKPKVFQSVKGMRDILPIDMPLWDKVNKTFKELADFYNFSPIITPIVEHYELFERSSGETSDIVEKEMFVIKAKSGDTLALRPEGTAGIVRAYLQNGMSHLAHPLKLSYCGPFFRYEQPQQARQRQFHQVGIEVFSHENDPVYDAQAILLGYRFLEELKIKNIVVQINSVGCRTCRPNYRKALVSYYKPKEKHLCADDKRRLQTNPLRLLDCKNRDCQQFKEEAPLVLDYLCSNCKKHFKEVLEYLEDIKLPYTLNNFLVRGLDYYTKTVFEFYVTGATPEDQLNFALGGGGRYDYLVEEFGGKSTAAVGFAIGIESTITAMKHQNITTNSRARERVFLIHIGDLAKKKSLSLIETLRAAHINVIESLGKESMAAQMRVADKMQSPLSLIFGQKEAYEGSIIIRDMKTGAQEIVPLTKVADMIKKKLSQ